MTCACCIYGVNSANIELMYVIYIMTCTCCMCGVNIVNIELMSYIYI